MLFVYQRIYMMEFMINTMEYILHSPHSNYQRLKPNSFGDVEKGTSKSKVIMKKVFRRGQKLEVFMSLVLSIY